MQYRPEIDGLRALAVVPVILFHAGVGPLSGGFVGVDVFFVISGYLITTILVEELASNRFSIVGFYERRARRILPALFVVVLGCLPFAWAWMTPDQFRDLSQSIAAVGLFVSNVFFLSEDSYFGPASEEKPLLHTWSLTVEEQYYVFFPLFLALCWRLGPRNVFRLIGVFALGSLAYSEFLVRSDPPAGFFLAPSRAWELLAGSLAAFVIRERGVGSSNALATIGLLAIVMANVTLSDAIPFPGLWAMLPVLGAVLVILFAGDGTHVARWLRRPPLVGIGLISYSAYLWHQPILALLRIRFFEPGPVLRWGAVGATVILAYLSWRYVEQPFRAHGGPVLARRVIFVFSGAGLSVLIALGIAGHGTFGFRDTSPQRLAAQALHDRLQPVPHLGACEHKVGEADACRTAPEPDVLLWGDSYAIHLLPGIIASEPDVSLAHYTKAACAPVLAMAATSASLPVARAKECVEFNNRVIAWLESNATVSTVVLSSNWYWVGTLGTVDEEGRQSATDVGQVVAQVVMTLERIRRLGVDVVLVSPTPHSKRNIGRCVLNEDLFGSVNDCHVPSEGVGPVWDMLRAPGVAESVYWLAEDMCIDGVCAARIEGEYVYRDNGHLTVAGSRLLGGSHGWMSAFRQQAKAHP